MVWWVGLVGAFAATLLLLKFVAVVHRVLSDLDALARMTRETTQGLAANTVAVSRLAGLDGAELGGALRAVASEAAALERSLEALPLSRAAGS